MSFSLDLSSLFEYAAQIFNSFGPMIAVIGGLILGVALVGFILNQIRKMFKG